MALPFSLGCGEPAASRECPARCGPHIRALGLFVEDFEDAVHGTEPDHAVDRAIRGNHKLDTARLVAGLAGPGRGGRRVVRRVTHGPGHRGRSRG